MAEDKTNMYLIAIVAIVAVVGLVVLLSGGKKVAVYGVSEAAYDAEEETFYTEDEENLVGDYRRRPLGQCFGANPVQCRQYDGMCTTWDGCGASGGRWQSYIPQMNKK